MKTLQPFFDRRNIDYLHINVAHKRRQDRRIPSKGEQLSNYNQIYFFLEVFMSIVRDQLFKEQGVQLLLHFLLPNRVLIHDAYLVYNKIL